MKLTLRLFAGTALAALLCAGAGAETRVGVSVQIGEPGFYGRIDIGNVPPPPVLYPQPVVIRPLPPGVAPAPVYLRVPPGHAKHWRKHCQRYNACGQPVYFVQDGWYLNEYAPRYREQHGRGPGERRAEGRGEGHDREHGKGRGHRGD